MFYFNIYWCMIKYIIFITLTLFGYLVWGKIYSYNINKAATFITDNALNKSKCCCALYVMRAMNAGGCPIGIYPAWMYKDVLPYYGFKEIDSNNYIPKKGDIIVIEKSKAHFWGHIAMYNGNQWISDFKQKSMNPYSKLYPYKLFRYSCY